MYAGAAPIWNSFVRLSKARNFTAFGTPLPIQYRDLRDEAARCDWFSAGEAEFILSALDDEFLLIAREQSEQAPDKTQDG